MPATEVTIFGGTGFLGHRISNKLLRNGVTVRIASRHPDSVRPPADATGRMVPVRTDIRDRSQVEQAVDGADGVVNAVSLYVERGELTFNAIHVEGARRVAEAASACGAERLIHLSGIGADIASSSSYVRSRAQGEEEVNTGFEHATIFRPSAMFGPDDALLSAFLSLAKWMPVVPLFGDGRTRLQPVFVGDVADAAVTVLTQEEAPERIYELGGPDVVTYRQLAETVMTTGGKKRPLVPVPEMIWDGLAASGSLLKNPPITEGQVALLKRDNVASPGRPGLADLGVDPTPIKAVLIQILHQNSKGN
ncbi:complex I NDUFA9 subunit family protein [Roseibium salinum]|uniref:Complex I NDUFA9 subunit family protein n=1 Tax=Roseibium salinum TaxID=1604349 RepID=A0ABT3R3V9_9HYPH|nr:complex I NDUFA9 subunit family protein [Roseibium sp. DSM 29163]MCX2723951.1 complex I NDUFA9 subunit family protein [Roseibium sp. DSM 29163]